MENYQKARIYELFDIDLEDDPESVINAVEKARQLWASWQIQAQIMDKYQITLLTVLHTLQSYKCGNTSPDLADEAIKYCELAFKHIEELRSLSRE